MSVREYIGARYVPLFMGEWNNTKSYEPLSIVEYQGNSYTSRQYVPSGIEITNENFWASTGNYNAQIEAYRQEVQTFNDRLNALEPQNKVMEVIQFDGTNTANGNIYNYTPTLVKCGDFSALIDTGYIGDSGIIAQKMINYHANLPLDLFVITHYHSDHASNFEYIMRNFCDSNTKIYVQMQPTQNNSEFTTYENYKRQIEALASSLGLTITVPTEDETITIKNVNITAWNTNPDNASVYDLDSWANNGVYKQPDDWEETHPGETFRNTSLNNYSLIVMFDCGGSRYLETGDIEGKAQMQNAKYIKRVNVMRSPHHLVNKNGYEEFFDKAMPETYIASGNLTDNYNIADFRSSYIYRYMIYNQINASIYFNINNDTICEIKDGKLINASGFLINKNFNPNMEGGTYLNLYSIYPPNLYIENPYQVYYTKIQDIWNIFRYMQGCPSFIIDVGVNSTTSTILSNSALVNELKTLFGEIGFNLTSSHRVVLDFFSKVPRFTINSSGNYMSYNNMSILIPQNYTSENKAFVYDASGPKFVYELNDISLAHEGNLSLLINDTVIFNKLMRVNAIQCHLSIGGNVILYRTTTDPDSNTQFEGMRYSPAGDGVLEILQITSAGIFTNYRHTFGSSEVTHPYIVDKIKVLF